ncbi:RagB/SusD family nutrient uptake outer membrane protein [Spirosoma harenae]
MREKFRLIPYLLIIPMIYAAGACKENFLDKKPLTATLQDLNQGGVSGQIYGLYSFLRGNVISVLPAMTFENFRDDDSEKGSSLSDGKDYGSIADDFQYTKDHWATNNYWADHYTLINQANTALQVAKEQDLTDDATKVNLAEARFFRGWAYFNLVRAYGEVPLIDFQVKKASDANVAKSPVTAIYKLIDDDLDYAATTLPLNWEPKFAGRLTKGAANALRARVALWTKNYPLALTSSELVINSGQYALLPTYHKVFKEEGENSSESIWELQNDVFTSGNGDYGMAWATSQGIRDPGIPSWNLGWGWNVPTQKLVDAYEKGDIRKNSTVLVSGESDDPTYGGYGRILPASKFDNPAGPMERKYWNKKVYVDEAYKKSLGFNTYDAPWPNKRMLRYADVLLMAAEAANETGAGGKAEQYLEQVRARARAGKTDVLPKVVFSDQTQMRAAIKHERRVELAMEGVRFYDLVRWGDALKELGPLGYTNRHRYMPIPQPEIDKSNGVLIQNPEW